MKTAKIVINISSAVLAFVAALLWWWSTKVEVEHDPNAVDENGWHPAAITATSSRNNGKVINVLNTAAHQVVWSRWAAMAAGGAAFLQGVAGLLPD